MDQEIDYTYGGQWFDDMGALALSFMDAPTTGVDIARSGLTRAQANDMAKNLLRTGITPYDEEATPIGMGDTGV
jgi:hypothetical protein